MAATGTTMRLRKLWQKVELKGNEEDHEQTDSWSNRDLIPLPPSRRTWGWFHFFGYWTISSLNVSNWQTPNTFLTYGLSVGQTMAVIAIGRLCIAFFSTLVAWCGLRWHIGYTVQNRFTWGLRGSWIPLLQRILLNFIWCAIQCWNGGRLAAVAITAIWPSFARMPNTLSANMPTTTYQFVGFVVFWTLSFPMLWIRPERFRLPFLITSAYCAIGMLAMLIWALSTAHGVGPLFHTGQTVSKTSTWGTSWLMLEGVNALLGGIAAGITNGSDFSRYARGRRHYVIGTVSSAWVVGTLVSLVGLAITSAAQKLYGEVYWNPPDLLMRMMESGQGSAGSRAAVFFLALGFGLTSMFENICGNAVAGGIDLAGLFPRYIDIRRGAVLTFVFVWVCQPWQLVNEATTFVSVLNSFAVFLAPIVGAMTCDFYVVRRGKVKLSHLYRTKDTSYWYTWGVNWRPIVSWLCGWAPTVGGLITITNPSLPQSHALLKAYYMSFFLGFAISFTLFYLLNLAFPVAGCGEVDEIDVYGTFTEKEAARLGVVAIGNAELFEGFEGDYGGAGESLKGAERETEMVISEK